MTAGYKYWQLLESVKGKNKMSDDGSINDNGQKLVILANFNLSLTFNCLIECLLSQFACSVCVNLVLIINKLSK